MSTRTTDRPTPLDLTVVTELLGPDPDLYAPKLPGETSEQLTARRTAAADIASDIDAAWQGASITEDGIDHVAALAHRKVELWGDQARDQVAAWLEEIRAGVAS